MYVLTHEDTLDGFVAFCTTQHSQENVLFWRDVRDFKALPATDTGALRLRATSIVEKVLLLSRELARYARARAVLASTFELIL
jgi:hypothetical protein